LIQLLYIAAILARIFTVVIPWHRCLHVIYDSIISGSVVKHYHRSYSVTLASFV